MMRHARTAPPLALAEETSTVVALAVIPEPADDTLAKLVATAVAFGNTGGVIVAIHPTH